MEANSSDDLAVEVPRMRHQPLCLALAPLAVALLALAAPRLAAAETRRLAVVIGNNAGGPSDKPLRYAEEDANKVADVLSQLGDVPPDSLVLLRGQGRSELADVLRRVTQRVADYRLNPADRSVLLFYFSGHSDEEALELGGDRMPFAELRRSLANTRADVRVAVVDGCKSGALVGKGGTRAPAFEIRLIDQLDASGEAMLTSSAADELALESREIRGSFFTHHLVSGLRGAADASGDGRITLSEAYQYAFDHTIAATAASGVRQHPGYDYRISGKGELVLTEITQPSASIQLPEGFERALVLLVRRDQVLAELSGGGARRIALAPGEYAVRVWKGTQAYAARVTVVAGEARILGWPELQPVPSPQVARKGATEERGTEELSDLTPEAQVEYLSKYFSVGDRLVLTATGTHASLRTTHVIYQGRYRKEMDEDDFFREVGRNDLAESYRNRRVARRGLIGVGIAGAIGTTVYALATAFGNDDCNVPVGDPNFGEACVEAPGRALGRAGGIFMVGLAASGGLILGAVLVNPHPVKVDELRRLADEYNVTLRRRLAAPAAPKPGDRDIVTFYVAPGAGPTVRGLTLGVAF